MKSLETFEENLSDAVLGYLSILIFSSFFFVIFGGKSYFCDIELWLLMDAYFRVCMIFATRSRKSLIDIMY
jgi:hypothetical protein